MQATNPSLVIASCVSRCPSPKAWEPNRRTHFCKDIFSVVLRCSEASPQPSTPSFRFVISQSAGLCASQAPGVSSWTRGDQGTGRDKCSS